MSARVVAVGSIRAGQLSVTTEPAPKPRRTPAVIEQHVYPPLPTEPAARRRAIAARKW